MTPDDVLRQLRDLEQLAHAGDDETAHAAEDRLRAEVLEAIASGRALHPETCARLALETRSVRFARRCG